MWVGSDGRGGFKHAVGKGPRLIIVHAGGEAGWTSKTDLIFRVKSKTGDYHHEMNSEHFLEWFENQLCTHIPAGSLIVLDNASYHNTQTEKIPTMSSRKSDMQSWLSNHSIAYEVSDLKADLMAKITNAKPIKQFETDLIAEKFTHRVLRLPVAHPELNPIEFAWSVVKGYVNKKFTLKEIEELVPQGISQVTPQMWKKFCDHTVKVEEEYWKKDGLVEDIVEEILITVGEDDDSDTSEEELEPDNDVHYHSTGSAHTPMKEKPCCSHQLQLEHTQLP